MSESLSNQSEYEVAHTVAIIEDSLRAGFLRDIASAKVDSLPEDLSPQEIAEVIVPEPKGEKGLAPRWTLVDKAEASISTKVATTANSEAILSTVTNLGLRKIVDGERQPEDIHKIDPEKAIFVVEGGANKTSIVRRGVAIKAMHEIYGDDLSSRTLYQLGSGRKIAPRREIDKPDGTKETVENAEHKVICDLADEFLPSEDTFTEFDANLATALAEGYSIEHSLGGQYHNKSVRAFELGHADPSFPKLVQVDCEGLEAGFDALRWIDASNPFGTPQLVIATNGQYREKDVYQAQLWGRANDVDMLPVVALGDEPGDSFPFKGEEITVPNRPESAYLNELVILHRLGIKQLPDSQI